MTDIIYYLDYKDVKNIDYIINIRKKDYLGEPTLIGGYGVLEYGSVKSNLDNIRGNGLSLNLEASLDLTLDDLYSEDENTFSVEMFRNNELLFIGFLKPDGIFQDWVNDKWIITLDCVDGLGILKDLAFVRPNGLHWSGKQSALEIIYNCLKRTNTSLNINTSVNVYYNGLTPSDTLDPLTQVYMSVDRFVKVDKDTIMDCSEVLTSVLSLFNAVISQKNGKWYIYRPNELYLNSVVKFREYKSEDNTYLGLNELDLSFNLGSQINGKYPHHCNANQSISIKGSVSAFRLNYKYGFLKGLLDNSRLEYSGTNYLLWDEIDTTNVLFDPLKSEGITFTDRVGANFPLVPIIKSQTLAFLKDEIGSLRITFATSPISSNNNLKFRIKQGVNYLSFFSNNDAISSSWGTSSDLYVEISAYGKGADAVYSLNFPPFLDDGVLTVEIIQPRITSGATAKSYTINSVDIVNVTNDNQGAKGEFHTVQRTTKPSSISKDVTEIFNGDSPSIIYDGAVFKSNKTTPTDLWYRKGSGESLPILRINAEDVLRANQLPAKQFSGNVYGYVPYLSIINIDSVIGKFMPIEYSFDTKTNILTLKLLEIFGNELTDISYLFTYDYGTTVKPTIN